MLSIIIIFIVTVHVFFLVLFFNKEIDKEALLLLYMLCFVIMSATVVMYLDYLMS